MKQRVIRLTLVTALALGMTALAAAPGGAAAPVQSCAHVKGTATLTPGLTTAPKNQSVVGKGTLTSCTPTKTSGGSGTLSASIKIAKGSCQGLATGKQKLVGTASTTWHNKKVSKYSLTFLTGSGKTATVATITGKVSSGLYAGHKVSGQIKFTENGSPNCTTKPVKSISFTSTKPWVIS